MNVKAYQVAENMDLRLILREFEEFFNMKHATSLTNPNIHVGMENGQYIVENDPTLVCTLQKSAIIFFLEIKDMEKEERKKQRFKIGAAFYSY